MPMCVIVTRDVPARFRGFLASCMLEIAPGVYTQPDMSASVRERAWTVLRRLVGLLRSGIGRDDVGCAEHAGAAGRVDAGRARQGFGRVRRTVHRQARAIARSERTLLDFRLLFGVSPARAGMDRNTPTASAYWRSFPRTRGDGPNLPSTTGIAFTFPPHARGWTRNWSRIRCGKSVSPARAGMDPKLVKDKMREKCFPRTRGDGPPIGTAPPERLGFPPHARGWTRRQARGGE